MQYGLNVSVGVYSQQVFCENRARVNHMGRTYNTFTGKINGVVPGIFSWEKHGSQEVRPGSPGGTKLSCLQSDYGQHSAAVTTLSSVGKKTGRSVIVHRGPSTRIDRARIPPSTI